jgi:hypothetical protein
MSAAATLQVDGELFNADDVHTVSNARSRSMSTCLDKPNRMIRASSSSCIVITNSETSAFLGLYCLHG